MNKVFLFEKFNQSTSIFSKIEIEYFNSPVVEFSLKAYDGYTVLKDKVVFGCKFHDGEDVPYLLHEMGHFITIKDPNRLLKNSYGLEYAKHEVHGELYDLPVTWNGIKNEIRAVVFQDVLAKHYGVDPEIKEWMKSMRLLDDFINVPPINSTRIDYEWIDNDTQKKVSYSEEGPRKMATMMNFFEEEKIKPQYNINHFNNEWFKRVEFLESKLL